MAITLALTILAYVLQGPVFGSIGTELCTALQGVFGKKGILWFVPYGKQTLFVRCCILVGAMICLNIYALRLSYAEIPALRHLHIYGHPNWTVVFLGSIAGCMHYAYSSIIAIFARMKIEPRLKSGVPVLLDGIPLRVSRG
jgi:hypothetical protein